MYFRISQIERIMVEPVQEYTYSAKWHKLNYWNVNTKDKLLNQVVLQSEYFSKTYDILCNWSLIVWYNSNYIQMQVQIFGTRCI